ncbi:hypothetical protein PhaeoP48_02916 [Phaeobacter inhibens]|nr:hypothetical protein PhaeoP48_02916 [Phaeobacter inhibens]
MAFDVVRALGFRNVVWRTPGADGGRDIEGYLQASDPTGYLQIQKWHIECKRYNSSINWPTVWEKVAHADALGADVLFLITNSNPSPTCETRISEWNDERRRPAIRVWRGYNFPSILRSNIDIAAGHGIVEPDLESKGLGAVFALELAKLVQSAHGAIEFESGSKSAIEAASALAELLEHRLRDLQKYGRFQKGPKLTKSSIPDWLKVGGEYDEVEEVSFLALAALMRHFMQSDIIDAQATGQQWTFSFGAPKRSTSSDLLSNFKNITHWLRIDDMVLQDEGKLSVRMRG